MGRTYLAELIEDTDVEKVMVLLAAGADPDVQRYPGGPTGLDAMFGAASQRTGGALDRVRDIVKALAADGRATVTPATRQHWLALSQQRGTAETREIAALLAQLKDRPPFAPACSLEKRWEHLLPR
jgi:hypothetical protein